MVADSDWIRCKQDELAWDLGYRPDPERAERVRTFFAKFLRHSKGSFAGKPFELLPWQWEHVVRPLFGWYRADGTRRFRRGYIEIPKKNGKSTLCAGLALYMLVADGETGAEVYCAASDKRQASIVYQEMRSMIEASPELAAVLPLIPSKKRVEFPMRNSFFEALSADAKTKEGYNAHGLIMDELHAWPGRRLWDALKYAGAARDQPLFLAITTAGYDRDSICYEQHKYAKNVIDGVIDDPHFLALIFAAGEGDDWTAESTWAKANPSYGVSIKRDEMAAEVAAAKGNPLAENTFKRYRLNIWTEQATLWLGLHLWDACTQEPKFEGECFGGLDLASTTDLAAAAFYYPENHSVTWNYWTTEDACKERERENRTRFDLWARQGKITIHPGAVIDYDRIRADINGVSKYSKLVQLGIDKWNATQLSTQLKGDGLDIVGFGQGFFQMSAPMKQLEVLIRSSVLRHGGNPVSRWCFRNLAAEQDAAGNVKPSKKRSGEKIDGIVSLIIAIGLAIARLQKKSVYGKGRGVMFR